MNLTSVQDAKAINVHGNGMLPLYRHGDQLIVSAEVPIKIGDRVIVELKDNSQICGTLFRKTKDSVEVKIGGKFRSGASVDVSDIVYLGRVIWASQ